MDLVQYTVRPGNTLYGIAQFIQTTVEEILKYKNMSIRNKDKIGINLISQFR